MAHKNEGNGLFPIFIKLDQLKTLIVGGGNVGLEKLEALLKNNPEAKVKLVGTVIQEEIKSLINDYEGVELVERPYSEADLDDVDVVILATESRALHVTILAQAKARKLLVNVADTPDLCDFYLGSTVKKGNLKVGISTNGKSPTFAKRFREVLEEVLPEDIDSLLDNLHEIRNSLKGDFSHKVKVLDEVTAVLRKEGIK